MEYQNDEVVNGVAISPGAQSQRDASRRRWGWMLPDDSQGYLPRYHIRRRFGSTAAASSEIFNCFALPMLSLLVLRPIELRDSIYMFARFRVMVQSKSRPKDVVPRISPAIEALLHLSSSANGYPISRHGGRNQASLPICSA